MAVHALLIESATAKMASKMPLIASAVDLAVSSAVPNSSLIDGKPSSGFISALTAILRLSTYSPIHVVNTASGGTLAMVPSRSLNDNRSSIVPMLPAASACSASFSALPATAMTFFTRATMPHSGSFNAEMSCIE